MSVSIMPIPSLGSQIYIVGGMSSPSPFCLTSVECYDIATGSWIEGVDSLPYPSAGVACVGLQISQ